MLAAPHPGQDTTKPARAKPTGKGIPSVQQQLDVGPGGDEDDRGRSQPVQGPESWSGIESRRPEAGADTHTRRHAGVPVFEVALGRHHAAVCLVLRFGYRLGKGPRPRPMTSCRRAGTGSEGVSCKNVVLGIVGQGTLTITAGHMTDFAAGLDWP